MADKNLTEIILIVDRSGSMSSIQADAEGGINSFIEEQKKASGRAKLTLTQFDHEYEVLHNGVDIQDVDKYSLVPRGTTALLDAIGRTINTVADRIKNTPKKKRAKHVITVIVTDGHENSSKEFTKAQITSAIKEQTDKNWEFIYLAANQDAIQEAKSMGIHTASNYRPTSSGISQTYSLISGKIRRARTTSSTFASTGTLPKNIEDDTTKDDKEGN